MGVKMWKCLNKEYIISNKWLKIRKDSILLPDGTKINDYYIIEKNNVVLVLALTSDLKVIIKKEYRYPIDSFLLELPGGTFNLDKETPLQVAKRELLEETGYTSDNWKKIGQFYDYPTKDTNKIYIYLASNIKKVADQKLDITEDIEYSFVDLKDIENLIMKGKINVSGSVAAILMAMKIIKNP